MNNNLIITTEIATSTIGSTAICNSINAEPLLTALITFGVSIVTLVGGELVKFLVTFLQKKRKELEDDKPKDEDDGKGDENDNG